MNESTNTDKPPVPQFNFNDKPPSPDLERSSSSAASKSTRKICRECNKPISGHFVRALDSVFHVDCFRCADCNSLCSSKFFPVDGNVPSTNGENTPPTSPTTQVPLCETCYFSRLSLLCFSCGGALRGAYITALGRKYHVEHFSCSKCNSVFGPEDSYYEHQGDIFCHYHYSTDFAAKCEGCQTSILKQFVEMYRGGKQQQWHPECYMIFKFWNVRISGVEKPQVESKDLLSLLETRMEERVLGVWTTLCGYEECTAACISDMLQYSASGKYQLALSATARLVFKTEQLFVGLDRLLALCGIDELEIHTSKQQGMHPPKLYDDLGKTPKKLCKKIVSFMSMVSKANEKKLPKMGVTQDLLSLVTTLAHYLKVLIRFGLSTALQHDRKVEFNDASGFSLFLSAAPTREPAVDVLLEGVSNTDPFDQPLMHLGVTALTPDVCVACGKSVEDSCVVLLDVASGSASASSNSSQKSHKSKRWHLECFKCSKTGAVLRSGDDIASAAYVDGEVVSEGHYPPSAILPFAVETRLSQLMFLAKIALARLNILLSRGQPPAGASLEAPRRSSAPDNRGTAGSANSNLNDIRKLRPDLRGEERRGSADTIGATFSKSSSDLNNDLDGYKMSDSARQSQTSAAERAKDRMKNEKSLTLDDIPRIVASEQARDIRPNAFKHQHLGESMKHLVTGGNVSSSVQSALSSTEPTSFSSAPSGSQPIRYMCDLGSVEMFIVRHVAVMMLRDLVKEWMSFEELLEMIDVKKSLSFWEKFGKAFGGKTNDGEYTASWDFDYRAAAERGLPPRKGSKGEKNDKSDKDSVVVFGGNLDILTEKFGVESHLGVSPQHKMRIPRFVEDCIDVMKTQDMTIEGVFRKNGNIRRLKVVTEEVNKSATKTSDFAKENSVQNAALFKKFLREMPNPLFTFKLHKLWISSQKIEDATTRKRVLHLAVCLLPRSHRDVTEVLLHFLKWVASFSHIDEESGSKMDAHNLATVITPNILYPKPTGKDHGPGSAGTPGSADSAAAAAAAATAAAAAASAGGGGDGYFLAIEAIHTLIEHHELFSEVPADLLEVLKETNLRAATADITTKEIMTRYDQMMGDPAARARIEAIRKRQSSGFRTPSMQVSHLNNLTTPAMAGETSETNTGGLHPSDAADCSDRMHSMVSTSSVGEQRPVPIRINTEMIQKMASRQERNTAIV